MVVEKLPVVILPSGRVPGRVLLVLPILEAAAAAEQRWDREKSSYFEGFGRRFNICQRGASEEPRGAQAPPRRGLGGGATRAPGALVSPPRLSFGRTVVSGTLIFYIFFLDFSWQFS